MPTFAEIDALVQQASQPLNIQWLDDQYAKVSSDVNTRLNYYRLLYLLVGKYHPQTCIELGVEFGIASAHMAVAASEYGGTVIGIDHNLYGIPMLLMGTYNNYHFVIGDTVQSFPDIQHLLGYQRNVGLVFQDSSHHYFESKREFELYSSLMPKGSLWVCDDVLPAFHDPKVDPPGKSMVEYFWELPGLKRVYPDILNKGNTVGIVIL